jgi:hypothetical protein
MRILCRTLFDCTYTGITGTFKASQLPFEDHAGQTINDYSEWNFSRNQQRNWETIMQMISLRAQPTVTSYPQQVDATWEFVFDVEVTGVYSANGDVNNYDSLLNECNGIPMITGLREALPTSAMLTAQGPDQNIWFETVNI